MNGVYSYGSDLRWRELDGIRVSETLMPAALSLEPHAHEPGQICFILEGEYEEQTRSGAYMLRPGVVQFHRPGEWHSNRTSDEEALTLLISFDRARWVDVTARHPVPAKALLSDLAREVRDELRHGNATALEGLALLILGRLREEPETTEPDWLRDAIAFIEHRYAERISLSNVATSVGVHRATLAAAFRRFRSISVGDYIRDVRLQHATRALMRSNAPIDEIAHEHGFSDQSHFGRLFRRVNGTSPASFRRRCLRSA